MSWELLVGRTEPVQLHIYDILDETLNVLKLRLRVDHISLTSAV